MIQYQLTLRYDNEERIKNRKAIFLDTNIWIDLAESKDSLIKNVRKKLERLVNDGIIFCPLSIAIFMEFHKQNYDSIKRLFPVIDALSLNLCMKERNVIYRVEIKNFIHNILLENKISILRNEIFAPYNCTVNDTINCDLPGFPNKNIMLSFFKAYHDRLINWKFSEYMCHMKDKIPQNNDLEADTFEKQFLVRKEKTKGNINKMHEMEEEFLIDEIIKPIFKEEITKVVNAKPTLAKKYIQYFNSFKINNEMKDVFTSQQILVECPLLHNTLEVMHFSGFDTQRKGRKTDFVDFEVMISSTSYYDILLTRDKWIYNLLKSNKSKLLSNTNIFKDYTEFNNYLGTLN